MKTLSERYFPEEEKITRYGFISHMEKYIKSLLINPRSARPDEYLRKYGIDWKEAQEMLLTPINPEDPESYILKKERKIKTGVDGKDKFIVKYKLPRKNFMNKMRNLFIKTFESNIITELNLNEEGEAAGATSCSSSGEYTAPLFGSPLKRKTIYITDEQSNTIQEATAGDIGQGYTVPFGDKNSDFYKESLNHKNMIKKSK